jgi:pimeloyl-ACP methyl ester carboxylesterase
MRAKQGELWVDDSGTGPAVVLLHGTPSAPEDFAPLVDILARDRRVLVPHAPGYGRTPRDLAPDSLADVVARLEETLLRVGVSETDFVAFSGGAYKAVAVALRGRVGLKLGRLALLSPVLGLDPPVAQAYRDLAAAARAGSFDPRPTWLDRMTAPGFATRDPAGAARVLAWLDAVPLSVLCDELVAMADAPDLRPRVAELACPLLVCAGTADHAVPPAWSRAVAASSPRGRFVSIEGAGHALLVEAPTPTLRVLGDFLGRVNAEPVSVLEEG